jgi:hypothetical protein
MIKGRLQYLWRDVDQDGEVLDVLVQSRRNKRAAKKFFRKLLKPFNMSRESSSPTSYAAMRPPRQRSCLVLTLSVPKLDCFLEDGGLRGDG